MIDELVKVADAMDNAGIVPMDWHPKLKVLPKVSKKAPCVRIWLTKDGHIKDLESLSSEHTAKLRKYEPDNGKSLPGFNVRPLYRQVRSDDEMKAKKFEKEIFSLLERGSFDCSPYMREKDDFWAKTRDGLEAILGRVRKQLQAICKDRLEGDETLAIFFETVAKIDLEKFQSEYATILRAKIEQGELPLSLMCYFVTEERKRKEDANPHAQVPKFSIFLDTVDYTEYPVAHDKTIARLNTLLASNSEDTDKDVAETSRKDAYGLDSWQADEKFPGVALSFLGSVILRSQAKTIPAQMRYHQCESATFPVGAETRRRTKAALEWIASP